METFFKQGRFCALFIFVLINLGTERIEAQLTLFKKPPKKVVWDYDQTRYISRRTINYRPFTIQDFAETGQQIPPGSKEVILKNGKRIRLDSLISLANVVERRLNGLGYSLRDRTGPKTIQHPRGDTSRVIRLNKTLLEKTKFSNQPPPKILRMSNQERSRVIMRETITLKELNSTYVSTVQQGTVPIAPPTFIDGRGSEDTPLGDPDLFALNLSRSVYVKATYNECSSEAKVAINASLFGNNATIISANGSVKSDTTENCSTNVSASVIGIDLVNFSVLSPTEVADEKSVDVGYSYDWYFWVGPIPFSCTLTLYGSAGISYYTVPGILNAELTFVPFVETGLDLHGGPNLLIAGGGVGCDFTLLSERESLYGKACQEMRLATPYKYEKHLAINYDHSFNLTALGGRIYAYAWIDLWLWSDSWDWTICDWSGFQGQGSLFNGSNETSWIDGGNVAIGQLARASLYNSIENSRNALTLKTYRHL